MTMLTKSLWGRRLDAAGIWQTAANCTYLHQSCLVKVCTRGDQCHDPLSLRTPHQLSSSSSSSSALMGFLSDNLQERHSIKSQATTPDRGRQGCCAEQELCMGVSISSGFTQLTMPRQDLQCIAGDVTMEIYLTRSSPVLPVELVAPVLAPASIRLSTHSPRP